MNSEACMRLDVTFYILAIVFFMIALFSLVLLEGTNQLIWLVPTGLVGVLSLCIGFMQRPKTTNSTPPQPPLPTPEPAETAPPPPPPETSPPTITETPKEETQQEPLPAPPPTIEQQVESTQPQVTEEKPEEIVEPPPPALEPAIEIEKDVEEQLETPQPPSIAVSQKDAEAAAAKSPLMQISGIGAKRASQLALLGIATLDDLANASSADVSKSLKISRKIVAKWVLAAKKLNKK